jgi:hypothetical protein
VVVRTKIAPVKKPDGDWLWVELIEALKKIDENGKLAKLNAVSISDNNGGRIAL